MNGAQPAERSLHECQRRQQDTERTEVQGLQNVRDEAHVVIQRNPARIGRLPGVAQPQPKHFQILNQIAVGDHDTLGIRGRT